MIKCDCRECDGDCDGLAAKLIEARFQLEDLKKANTFLALRVGRLLNERDLLKAEAERSDTENKYWRDLILRSTLRLPGVLIQHGEPAPKT